MTSPSNASLRLRRMTSSLFSTPFSPSSPLSAGAHHPNERTLSEVPNEMNHYAINVDLARQFLHPWPNHNEDHVQDIEADVLYPQYQAGNIDLSSLKEILRRKSSADKDTITLIRPGHKPSKGFSDSRFKHDSPDTEHFRYRIYSALPNGHPTQPLQHLLTEESRHVLEYVLKLPGWWIDVLSPTNEEMRILSKTFNIHPLTAEDIFAQEPRDKLELFPNYIFICFRSFVVDTSTDLIIPFTFYHLIFKEGFLTFHFKSSFLPEKVRRRTDQLKAHVKVTPDWLNYALMDAVTDEFAPVLRQIETEAMAIDELPFVLKNYEKADMLRRITRCRRRSTQLSRLLSSKLDVIKSLIKRYDDWAKDDNIDSELLPAHRKILSDVCLYLGDVQDHVVTMTQNINHYNRILSRAHTNHLAQVSAELTETYNMTNSVMNRLTFLATTFIPMSLVGGLFGMNVKVAGSNYQDLNFFFWIICCMALYAVVMVCYGRYIKLL